MTSMRVLLTGLLSLCFVVPAALLTASPAQGETFRRASRALTNAKTAATKEADTPQKGEKADAEETEEAEVETLKWAEIKISGMLPEGPSLPGLFGEISESLNRLFERLDQAKEDKNIKGIVLRIENPILGLGGTHELRTKILEVRKSGKPVYALLETALTSDYLIATACDKIYMPESGLLVMTGLRAEVSFYKNLFDKLDIQADILRVGKYKSAAEPYSRTEMSPEFKEEVEELLDGQYNLIVNTIAEARKLDVEAVKKAIDNGPHTPTSAQEFGLIDEVRYADELEQIVIGDKKNVKFEKVEKYGKKKVDTDFEGFTGLVKMMNLMMGVEPGKKKTSTPQIAVIYATGTIIGGRGTSGLFGDDMIGSESMIETIREAAENSRVKAIVLRINSPGGSATASDQIWRALEKVDKPIVVSMGNVAASGGYYIAMGSDYIFAEPGTITGSIGVVGGKIAFEGLFEKLGITTSIVSRGQNSGAMSMLTPFTESERQAMQKMMNEIYEIFTKKAAEGRNMQLEDLKALAGGRIYTGEMAAQNGLIDEVGTLDQAVTKAAELAELDKPSEVERLLLPKPTSPFEQLFGPIDTQTRAAAVSAPWEQFLPAELTETLRKALLVETLSSSEPRLLLMPFDLKIK